MPINEQMATIFIPILLRSRNSMVRTSRTNPMVIRYLFKLPNTDDNSMILMQVSMLLFFRVKE